MSEDFKVGDMKELKNLKITSGVFDPNPPLISIY